MQYSKEELSLYRIARAKEDIASSTIVLEADVLIAGRDEFEAIADLERMIFSDAWSYESIEKAFHQKQVFVLTAKYSEKVIGYCVVYYALDQGEIARIAVHPKYREAGVGGRLFAEVQKQCLKRGIGQLFLEVRESNQAAISLYRKFGFAVDGIRKDFYTDPFEHAVVMSNRSVSKADTPLAQVRRDILE